MIYKKEFINLLVMQFPELGFLHTSFSCARTFWNWFSIESSKDTDKYIYVMWSLESLLV